MVLSWAKNFRQSQRFKKINPVFLYHHVGVGGHVAHLHDIDKRSFETQIRNLQKQFTIVFIDDYLHQLANGQDVTGLACITFDDATQSASRHAWPLLEALQVPATVFVNSSLVTGGAFWRDHIRIIIASNAVASCVQYLGERGIHYAETNFYHDTKKINLDQQHKLAQALAAFVSEHKLTATADYVQYAGIQEMAQAGYQWIKFGNHSANHYVLAGLNEQEQASEIETTKRFLAGNFPADRISNVFSIPFGDSTSFTKTTLQLIKSMGYAYALTSDTGVYFKAPHISQQEGVFLCNRFMPKNSTRFIF